MAVSFPRYLAPGITLAAGVCDSEPAGLRALPVVSITVTPNALTLPVGASRTLAAAVHDLEGRPLEGCEIRWSSSAPAWGAESYPRIHFELRYNNRDPGDNPVLDELLIDGRTLTEYRVSQ